ncbi:OmpH family outer membrane protein [Neptunomonas japonica]|uniref:Outer membrane protein n=1 Tax=Neptunomonas japonica JAMM 1380 TaxID=1441457 RepID=A0A7R6PEC1_9GAMM|nr:OmpH family outer membrane protein [Neptunomonas japonica]BBB28537.1 outer membrane protein [Neptunomonas japonica JAMM 1380]
MKLLKIIAVSVSIAFAPVVFADKLAVLGVQEALLKSNAAASFKKSLQNELKGDESRLLELEKQAKMMREKIQKNSSSMSDNELKQARLQFQKVFQEYQRNGQELQQKRAEREQGFIKDMKPKLDDIIRKIIKDNKYDVILAKQATVYYGKGFDITPTVVKLLNK